MGKEKEERYEIRRCVAMKLEHGERSAESPIIYGGLREIKADKNHQIGMFTIPQNSTKIH